MLTYENLIKTLNEQEDDILVKIHNKYCEKRDKMYLYIYNNTPDNVERLLPEQRYECLLEGQYIRDTYIQSDKWVQMDEQGHIISENEAKGTLLFLSDLAVWLQTFKFKDIKELKSYIERYKEEK
jgi:hypothetical protein|nr:MAG TPA_asm: hypothetical protein [Caudoviricetes sp.]